MLGLLTILAVSLGLSGAISAAPANAAISCVPPLSYVVQTDLFERTSCGNTTTTVLANVGGGATLSPDGRYVATTSVPPYSDITVKSVDGTSSQDIGRGLDQAWTVDGQGLLFVYNDGNGNAGIFTRNRDGSGLREVAPGESEPAPSPDGTRVAGVGYDSSSNGYTLNIHDMDGTNGSVLFTSLPADQIVGRPAWTPDGNYLVFTLAHSGNFELYVVGAKGGSAVQLPSLPGGDSQPTIARDWTLGYINDTGGPHLAIQTINDPSGAIIYPYVNSFDRAEFRPEGPVTAPPANWPPAGVSTPDGSPTPTSTPTTTVTPDEYQALGDSFSSGEGAPGPSGFLPGTDVSNADMCHRSIEAYPEIVKSLKGMPGISGFHACSGAIIQDFFTPYPDNHVNKGKPVNPDENVPQLQWLSNRTQAATLTVGGNNMFFPEVMAYCATRAFWQQNCQKVWSSAVDAEYKNIAMGTGSGHDNLPDLYKAIRAKAPNTTVYVLGYPRFFALNRTAACFTGVPDRFFQASDMRWINGEISKYDSLVQKLATAAGFKYINEYNALNGHELCTIHSWINSANLLHQQQSFHPNLKGQAAMAAIFARQR